MPSAMRIGSLQSATILILSAIALGCASRVWGTGWKLVTVSNEVSSIKYCLANDRGAKARSGYTFPEYNTSDTMLFEGYELLNRVKGWKATFGHVKKGDVAHFAWSKKFTSLYIDSTTAINQRLYTEGVDDYSIRLRLTNGHWFSKKFKLPHEYYQVPRTDEIVKWKSVTSNLSVGDLLRDVDSSTGIKMGIDSLIVVTTPKEKYKFVFGSFRLVDRVQVKRSVYHPLFDPILDYSGTRYFEKDNFYSPRGVPGLILPMAYYALHGHPNATFYFEEDSPNTHEILKLKIKTFRRIVDTYPFYQERKLDKHSTLERLDSFNSLVDNEAYSDSIAALFRDFGDPHLKIVDSSKKRQKRNVPIVPYELNGHTYVAVVLDSRLADEVPIGSEILEIDGQAVLAARSSGLSVRTLLTKEKGSQASLLLSHKSRLPWNVTLNYDINFQLPKNLVPVHGEFKMLPEKIAYLRLKNWGIDVWIRFLNHWPEIVGSRGLILDLRSNGGGDLFSVMRIASVFVTKPTLMSHMKTPADGRIESTIISPNPKFQTNIPLVILGNKSTACASEEFISTMQNNKRAILVASSRTAGAYSMMVDLVFPDGAHARVNSWSVPIDPSGKRKEAIGIEPDVWVYLDSVEDLAHLNDKMREVALKILQ